MGGASWIEGNWQALFSVAAGVGSILFTAFTVRADAKARRIGNLLTLTQHHREIWTQIFERPALARVLKSDVDLAHHPVTVEERIFVSLFVVHLNALYQATEAGMFRKPEGADQDLHKLFSHPIFKTVWHQIKPLQDKKFARFMEKSIGK